MTEYFSKIVNLVAGSTVTLPNEKLKTIFQGLLFAGFFVLFFTFIYYKYSKNHPELRRLFLWTAGILSFIVAAKYVIFHFWKGYIPDRFLFYAVPSPKAEGIIWFFGTIAIFAIFLLFRKKIEALPSIKFLLVLWLVFVTFSLSVAAIREGTFSIYEPFTRTYWEYTGNLPLVKNIPDFLHNYSILQPQLAKHTGTHPPGYTITLYIFQQLFSSKLAFLAVLAVMFGGLVIFPLYYFLKNFADEETVRRGLQIFIFLPSFVIMGATSMEITFLFFVWLAIFVLYVGWGHNLSISFLGGLLAALALFQNFLFLLLTPLFLVLLIYKYFSMVPENRYLLIWRVLASIFGFLTFYLSLYLLVNYSIIDNFFMAQKVNSEAVESNFRTIFVYLKYFAINILAFGVYFGIANILLFGRNLKGFFSRDRIIDLLGFATLAFFLIIGMFQGEVERLWIFLIPLFILPLSRLFKENNSKFSAVISLLFFQIIIIQTLFYTYW